MEDTWIYHLPFILSAPIHLFCEELENKQYRGALLTLKDCYEGVLKFYSSLLYTDAINHIFSHNFKENKVINDEFLNNLQLLFSKPPSNGDWLEFYFRTAILLNGNGLAGQLCFPEVVYLVCKPKKSRCKTKAAKILQDFVSWRNSTIGHGTTSHDLEQIKEDLINRKEILEFIGHVLLLQFWQ